MIDHLSGRLTLKSPEYIVIDVGGVGYGVSISLTTFSALPQEKEETTIFTYTHVRDNAMELYGFSTLPERDIFQLLISITKVGPKMARNILSKYEVPDLIRAISEEDLLKIKAIPGVGLKTAKRIIMELKDKLQRCQGSGERNATPKNSIVQDAVSALINLGYSKTIAEKTIQKCIKMMGNGTLHLEEIIKKALELQT
ncbi:MAG: Holliday junction branch migration protein RuvA [bacterium]